VTKRGRTTLAALAGLLVVVLGVFALLPRGTPATAEPQRSPAPSVTPQPSPSSLPSPSRAVRAASPMPLPQPPPTPSPVAPSMQQGSGDAPSSLAAQECSTPESSFVPTRFTLERLGVHERVLSMATVSGQVPSPPKSDRRSAAWWNEGPAPGSGRGKAVLTIHTYRPSLRPALGNELFAGGASQLRPGDVIKLHGSAGQIACYRFIEAPKIRVSEYDHASGLMVDPDGAPSLAIVICWDFNARTSDWDSRVMFQFEQV
jgi:hypothetical protein